MRSRIDRSYKKLVKLQEVGYVLMSRCERKPLHPHQDAILTHMLTASHHLSRPRRSMIECKPDVELLPAFCIKLYNPDNELTLITCYEPIKWRRKAITLSAKDKENKKKALNHMMRLAILYGRGRYETI